MLSQGIIHAKLAAALARLRHTDIFVISDSGFPTPPGVEVIDLAIVYGVPTFDSVLAAVAAEIVVEKATMATETYEHNAPKADRIRAFFPDVVEVSHEHLKLMAASAQLVVRTGEATPYSNVVLQAVVAFA